MELIGWILLVVIIGVVAILIYRNNQKKGDQILAAGEAAAKDLAAKAKAKVEEFTVKKN